MKTNHFQLIEKRENIFPSQRMLIIPNKAIATRQQQKYQTTKAFNISAKNQNNPSQTTTGTSTQTSEAVCEQTRGNHQKETSHSWNSTKWNLISLVISLVIIIWLNNSNLMVISNY